MPENLYPTETEDELLKIRGDLMQARRGGSLTSVGIEPRISHQFNKMTRDELDLSLNEVRYALYLIGINSNDPVKMQNYQNPYARPRVTTMNYC